MHMPSTVYVVYHEANAVYVVQKHIPRPLLYTNGGKPMLRERGSAPKRGRHSTISFSTKCICAVAA